MPFALKRSLAPVSCRIKSRYLNLIFKTLHKLPCNLIFVNPHTPGLSRFSPFLGEAVWFSTSVYAVLSLEYISPVFVFCQEDSSSRTNSNVTLFNCLKQMKSPPHPQFPQTSFSAFFCLFHWTVSIFRT